MKNPIAAGSGTMRLEGKIALITGAACGIGLSIARAFDREGARVILTDINHAEVAREAPGSGRVRRCLMCAMRKTGAA